jgi:peptide/nickel transport system substrate-binding protein
MKYSDGKLVTDLAQSYKVSDDGLVYSFKLKPNASFHDGKPLTAEDIAFTIQKVQDPALKSPRRIDWADISVKVVSATEIEFILKQSYTPFLSNTTIGILPKHIWGSVSDDQFIFSQYNTTPIGSGIYKISSVSHDSGGIPTSYDLVSWRGYYGKAPYIPRISFEFFADEEDALIALDQGYIDSIPSLSPSAAHTLATNTAQGYDVLSAPLPRIFGIFLNQSQAPILSDKVVRQALDMSIDRTALVEAILKGYGAPVNGPTLLTISTSTNLIAASSSGMVSAQALLVRNGWKHGEDGVMSKRPSKSTASTTISFNIYTADSPDLKQAAELVKETWNAMGAQVEVKVYEQNDLYQNIIRTRKYDALLFGEAIGKDRDLYAFWHSSQRNAPGLNIAMYANSKTDKILEDMRTTNDDAERVTKYTQFDQLVRADIPAIFLYVPDFIYAVPKSVRGINLGSMSAPADRWSSVGNWYIETERVWNIFN